MTAPPVLQARRLRDGRRFVQVWCARCGATRWISAGTPSRCDCREEPWHSR